MGEYKYICGYSGGKDSTATVILAHLNNEPLDVIVFSEVMFDENISGELPEHVDFVKNKAFPLFESWGYKCIILHSDKTFMDMFNHVKTKSKIESRNGMKNGFPLAGRCFINSCCKIKPINQFNKQNPNAITYVGIATDEPKRLDKLHNRDNQISLLEKYNLSEKDAYKLCEEYDLLSPVYDFVKRGGCWFCPNIREDEMLHLRQCHRDLYDMLLTLEQDPLILNRKWLGYGKYNLLDYERKFILQENQLKLY